MEHTKLMFALRIIKDYVIYLYFFYVLRILLLVFFCLLLVGFAILDVVFFVYDMG